MLASYFFRERKHARDVLPMSPNRCHLCLRFAHGVSTGVLSYDSTMNGEDREKFRQVVERFAPGSRLLDARELEGGVSARTVAVEFERSGGGRERAVVRLHGVVDRGANPDIAADEFRLLEIVHAAGIPVPAPLYLDESCELFDIPCLVIEFIDGAPDFEPIDIPACVRAIAQQLAAIHRIEVSAGDLSFLPAQEDAVIRLLRNRPEHLDESLNESQIRAALEAAWPPVQGNEPRLLHGDYWPGNIMWSDGEIAAVIDWEDAATGDPLADLGNCRLEILWAFGSDVMDAFTDHYRLLMPSLDYASLPLWDLYAALHPAGKLSGWGLEPETVARMVAAHRKFVDTALAELAGFRSG